MPPPPSVLHLYAAVSWPRNDCTILAELSERITQLQYLFQLSWRTSENAQNANFAEFYKSEVQLRRIPIPRTPVNKDEKKGRGQLTMALQMLPVRVGVRFLRLAY